MGTSSLDCVRAVKDKDFFRELADLYVCFGGLKATLSPFLDVSTFSIAERKEIHLFAGAFAYTTESEVAHVE